MKWNTVAWMACDIIKMLHVVRDRQNEDRVHVWLLTKLINFLFK